jgi:uroporphyrinogen decarboxylase
MNMKLWTEQMIAAPVKKAMPLLSFPSVQLLKKEVREVVLDSTLQAQGMKLIADLTNACASVSYMDLSVEAEAFGSQIRYANHEVPTVVGHIIETMEQADALSVPQLGAGRTGVCIDAIQKAVELISDRPVFANAIGPFSLAGRLLDVSEAMVYCFEEPDMVHAVLNKAAEFIVRYIKALKAAGADGVIIAEPLAGVLSAKLNAEFSVPYVRRIVDQVQSDEFIVIYHNCGNEVPRLIQDIVTCGAAGYHFGNAVDMAQILKHIPENVLVMGNIDPTGQFNNGTPGSIRKATLDLLGACREYPNFVISSGCDIPPHASWRNIHSFFHAVSEFYTEMRLASALPA